MTQQLFERDEVPSTARPTMGGIANDQHPDDNVAEGELLIRDVYQAIRESKYWEKRLFVIVYDERGGFFDHVRPPQTVPSGREKAGASTFDCARLGVFAFRPSYRTHALAIRAECALWGGEGHPHCVTGRGINF